MLFWLSSLKKIVTAHPSSRAPRGISMMLRGARDDVRCELLQKIYSLFFKIDHRMFCIGLLFVSSTLSAAITPLPSIDIRGINGNERVNVEKRIKELQQLKPLDELGQEEVRLQIISALNPFGYLKPQVTIARMTPQKISVYIIPGPQVHITALHLDLTGEGANNPTLRQTLKDLPLTVGAPLLGEQYTQAKQMMVTTADHLGYLHGSFKKAEILIDEDKNIAEITLVFATGPLFYFGQIEFDPTYINPSLLHRFVPFKPGQPYSTDQVLQCNKYLADSGYFSSVQVKPQIGDDGTVPIKVQLNPVPKYSYTLGAGFGTDTGIRGRAGLYVVPVNRKGDRFNVVGQGSFTQNALQAQYLMPGENPVTDQYSLSGNYSNLNYDTGYSNAYLLSFAKQYNSEYFKRSLSINGLYESFNYNEQANTQKFIAYPKATLTFRQVQNPLFSPSGYNVTLNGLGANRLVLSTVNFVQTSLDVKAAYTFEPWHLRLYGHTIQGITATPDINQLPLTLALLLGGTDNLKGYSFNSIGPGKIISYAGFELQKETVANWYLIGFFDAGDVYNPVERSTLYDVGVSLMWVSPIGPIKIGLAQAVNNKLQRTDSSPRLVIDMGPDL